MRWPRRAPCKIPHSRWILKHMHVACRALSLFLFCLLARRRVGARTKSRRKEGRKEGRKGGDLWMVGEIGTRTQTDGVILLKEEARDTKRVRMNGKKQNRERGNRDTERQRENGVLLLWLRGCTRTAKKRETEREGGKRMPLRLGRGETERDRQTWVDGQGNCEKQVRNRCVCSHGCTMLCLHPNHVRPFIYPSFLGVAVVIVLWVHFSSAQFAPRPLLGCTPPTLRNSNCKMNTNCLHIFAIVKGVPLFRSTSISI